MSHTPSAHGYFEPPVKYEQFQKALELACYYQNRCCDLEEIIEMFCLDADDQQRLVDLMENIRGGVYLS